MKDKDWQEGGPASPLMEMPRRLTESARLKIERKRTEQQRDLSLRILECLSRSGDQRQLIREILLFVTEFSGCDAVGIRLREGDDFPYYETSGFVEGHVRLENRLCAIDQKGDLIRDSQGNPVLECMCGNVICGRFDPEKPFFTKEGSFWTNSTTDLLASTTDEDRQARTRNRCNGESYESVALIPLRSEKSNIGLLQLNDFRRNRFTIESIRYYESIAQSIRIVVMHKRAEDALRESESRYRTLFDHSLDGICVVDENMKILLANQAAANIMRLDSPEEVLGVDPFDLIPPEERERALRLLKKDMFEKDLRRVNDLRMLNKMGEEIWISAVGALTEYQGRVVGLASFRDVTERKRMEQELRKHRDHLERLVAERTQELERANEQLGQEIAERQRAAEAVRLSEEKYHTLYESSKDGIIFSDMQSGMLDANQAYLDMLGYTLEQLRHLTFRQSTPEKWHEMIRDVVRNQITTRGYCDEYEQEVIRKDGTILPVSVRAWLISDSQGKPAGMWAIVRDITHRKKVEQELALRARLLDAATDSIVLYDLDGNIIYANEETYRPLGYEKDEFMAINLRTLAGPENRGVVDRWLRRMIKEGEATFETSGRHKDGSLVPLEARARVIETDGQKRILSVARDVTELRRTQEQLQQSQLMASLGEMTAGIASVVTDPLDNIALYSELLLSTHAAKREKKVFEAIRDEARFAARIMKDLLAYGHARESQKSRLNLHGLLKNVLDVHRCEETPHNITVSAHFVDGPLYVRGDRSQLTQVFMNLMMNAEEALRDRDGGSIVITTERDGDWAKVSIADDGIGIPKENLRQVFYPLFTTRQVAKGAGLGLSTCYRIITDHNGLIYAENNETGGATFTVELPRPAIRTRK